jgi:putative transposase
LFSTFAENFCWKSMKAPLEYGKLYHVFNRGNNRHNIFVNDEDYLHFLKLYALYIETVADTFAWCLMKNHFHVLVRIRYFDEIGYLDSKSVKSSDLYLKWKTHFPDNPDMNYSTKPRPERQFQHLFSAYSKWFNKRHNRSGSLFENTFDRKLINHQKYFRNMIVYIHQNPIKHGFADHILDYPWTSYLTVLSSMGTRLKRQAVIDGFSDIQTFENEHQVPLDISPIEHLIIE